MIDCFKERLEKAECCAAELASKYVTALNHGESDGQQYITLMLVNAYVGALERYRYKTEVCMPQGYIKYNNVFLTFNNKSLYLSTPTHKVTVHPDCVNCLNENDVERIFEQITTLCGGCSCNC